MCRIDRPGFIENVVTDRSEQYRDEGCMIWYGSCRRTRCSCCARHRMGFSVLEHLLSATRTLSEPHDAAFFERELASLLLDRVFDAHCHLLESELMPLPGPLGGRGRHVSLAVRGDAGVGREAPDDRTGTDGAREPSFCQADVLVRAADRQPGRGRFLERRGAALRSVVAGGRAVPDGARPRLILQRSIRSLTTLATAVVP